MIYVDPSESNPGKGSVSKKNAEKENASVPFKKTESTQVAFSGKTSAGKKRKALVLIPENASENEMAPDPDQAKKRRTWKASLLNTADLTFSNVHCLVFKSTCVRF